MRQLVPLSMVALTAVAVATAAEAQAPAKKATAPAPAPAPTSAPVGKRDPAAKKATAPAPTATSQDVLATVNGETITRGEVVEQLGLYPVDPNLKEQELYDSTIDRLVNTKLLTQFLAREKVAVSDKEINEMVLSIEKDLRANNQDLATKMTETGTSMAELRNKIMRRLQWKNYVIAHATDPVLRKFTEENKDALNGAQVRASHIFLSVDLDAMPAEKEKARQKLLAIKQEIESGKISFADAANKYSEDPINVQTKAGGDLDFFPRKGQFLEKFSSAAFALKKGAISNPVETELGWHLVQVTDRREGQPIDLAQVRDEILSHYAGDLQERIIAAERKVAKVEVKPMPADLFQPPPTDPGAPAATATPAAATRTATPGAAPKAAAPAPAPKAAPR
jgi:peptidyl-prolyl cis-trans isomerase C